MVGRSRTLTYAMICGMSVRTTLLNQTVKPANVVLVSVVVYSALCEHSYVAQVVIVFNDVMQIRV